MNQNGNNGEFIEEEFVNKFRGSEKRGIILQMLQEEPNYVDKARNEVPPTTHFTLV